jgi:2-keto-4-pentenoate hydratase
MTPVALLAHSDQARLWPATAPAPTADLPAAYADAREVHALRRARGEIVRGYKLGFTNRNLWPRYNVYQPIWGTVWNTTVQQAEGADHLPLRRLCQPRIEPEAVFAFKADLVPSGEAPPSLQTLFEALDWVAPGFELVQSHLADWKFTAAQAVADNALHGRLLVGERMPVRSLAADGEGLHQLLAQTRVALHRNGQRVEEAAGALVLDGPLLALLHFVHSIWPQPGGPVLRAGDIVTTGSWTDAWPVKPGQHWSARFNQALPALEVAFR